MTSRRRFLASAATASAAMGLATSSKTRADEPKSAGAGTWLTYAVNIEMTFAKLPVLDRLRKVAEAGFTHYEFWPHASKDIDAMARVNKELGLTPTQFSAYWGITDPKRKDDFLSKLKACLPVAEKLGVKMLCVVAGEESEGHAREAQDAAVIDALKAGAEIVTPAGITIILEPLNVLVDHPKQHVITSAHAARLLKEVGSPNVKMLFDCYHQQISEGNLTGNIRKYKDLIGYYQVADHPGRFEPSTGEVNYAHVFRTIHDVGYRGAIGLEFRPKGDAMIALKAVREADTRAKTLER